MRLFDGLSNVRRGPKWLFYHAVRQTVKWIKVCAIKHPMKKSTVIATCLFNSHIAYPLPDAEHLVKMEFEKNFPLENFHVWNSEIHEQTAEHLIRNRSNAMRINVKAFIEELWHVR